MRKIKPKIKSKYDRKRTQRQKSQRKDLAAVPND